MEIDKFEHHMGFEKEELFSTVLSEICCEVYGFKSNHLKEIIKSICPEFLVGLHEYRPCRRKLVYVGFKYFDCDEEPDDDSFFKIGEHYYSEAFNGGTYIIEGFTDGPIGCSYFEIVEIVEDRTDANISDSALR